MLTGFMLCPHLGEAMLKFECANLVCVVSRTWRGSVEHADLVCVLCPHLGQVMLNMLTWSVLCSHLGEVMLNMLAWFVLCPDLGQVMLNVLTWCVLCPHRAQVMLNMLTWFVLCPDLGEAMLNVLGCLVPFLEHDLLDSLPYTVASTLATFPPTLHKDTIDLLCSSLLPMTLGQHLQFFVCFYSPIICANLTGTAPAPLIPASLPPATPKTDSAPRPHPQRSTGDVRSLVGYHPMRHSTVAKSFLWCLVMPVLFQHMQDIPYYAPY